MKAWMSSNFDKFATELLPLIDVRMEFLARLHEVQKSYCSHHGRTCSRSRSRVRSRSHSRSTLC